LVELIKKADVEGVRGLLHPESPEIPLNTENAGALGREFTDVSTEVLEQSSNRAVMSIEVNVEGRVFSSEVEFRVSEGEWLIYEFLSGSDDFEGSG
jgi:hypothetical protein